METVEGSFLDGMAPAFSAADIRFTTRADPTGDYLYAIALGWPDDGVLRIRSLGSGSGLLGTAPAKVEVLGSPEPVSWERRVADLRVRLPQARPCEHGVVVRFTLARPEPKPRSDQFH